MTKNAILAQEAARLAPSILLPWAKKQKREESKGKTFDGMWEKKGAARGVEGAYL